MKTLLIERVWGVGRRGENFKKDVETLRETIDKCFCDDKHGCCCFLLMIGRLPLFVQKILTPLSFHTFTKVRYH